ncbi:MAG: energy-coupling factor ABC transporter ATP-binding protein [Candidatus Kariarchaeaceae archaeon]|jgi:cobalt/nickel transport system ATP-binding protein
MSRKRKQVVLETQNLRYTYPNSGTWILRGVNLKVKDLEMVAVAGRVGAGKSTLLRHLNGIIKPQHGDVRINGESVKENPNKPFHQEVGLLFENPDDQIFYPIVADDIAFGPRNLGIPKSEVYDRVIQASEEVRILHLLERETSTLSFGEKTLVAIAGLLAMKPDILLLDTPEVGVDLWTKPEVLNLLLKLKMGHTVVVSTNDIDILNLADRILILWDGKIRGDFDGFNAFMEAYTT